MENKLYICSTPIGNLEDITLRVLNTLRECGTVYCEDTRNTIKLLNRYEIKKPLISCHEHNEAERAVEICRFVLDGNSAAYVSDAGMPGISDPGARLIRECLATGTPFELLPGACAAACAYVMSGLGDGRFLFEGFLPRRKGERARVLEELKALERSIVFYESPHRAADTLRELFETFGERNAALVREITKLHEEAKRMPLSELAAFYAQTPPRGECVIVVEGARKSCACEDNAQESVEEAIRRLTGGGMSAKETAKELAKSRGLDRNTVYKTAVEIINNSDMYIE